jgi:excinuclease ABC subunit B
VDGEAGRVGGSRARKNTLDEMTVRRTEIPVQGPRPQKPSIDYMGPGTDRETPVPKPVPPKPRSFGGKPGSHAGKKGRR